MMIHFFRTLPLVVFLSLAQGVAQEATQEAAPRDDLDYRSIRREAIGREHDQIKTPRGTIFYKVSIERIDNSRVTIQHQDGRSLLEFESIPVEWIKEFNIIEKPKSKSKSRSRSSRLPKAKTPEFDLSGVVSIGGDAQSGHGILVKVEDKFYVYTDCSILSGNKKLSFQSKAGLVLQPAQVIECAEGSVLARIQVRPVTGDTNPITLADQAEGEKLQAHQYLYFLKQGQQAPPTKIESIKNASIKLSSRLARTDKGVALMTGSKKAIALVVGGLPQSQRLASRSGIVSHQGRFESNDVNLLRLDRDYQWKTVKLAKFLAAKTMILKFDKSTQIYKAIADCQLSNGKITIPAEIKSLSKRATKNRDVEALIKLNEELEKKSLKVNEKAVQRKLDSVLDTAFRRAKKQTAAISLDSYSWYHRHFLAQSLAWRKTMLAQMER